MLRIRTWVAALSALGLWLSAGAADIDWSKVDAALGKKGVDLPGGVHKYGLPRSDLSVTAMVLRSSRHSRSVAGSLSSQWVSRQWSWAILS